MKHHEEKITQAALIIKKAHRMTAASGAGISAESGIPTFRDPGGIWDHMDMLEVGTASGFVNAIERNAETLFPLFINILDAFQYAEPNPGHMALSDMEKMGILKTIITQNVDNLHQEAGNTNVVEVHGNVFRSRCINCSHRVTVDRKIYIRELKEKIDRLMSFNLENLLSLVMICDKCGSMMRPDVVMFGEQVHDLQNAFEAARNCDVMIILGTSGVVYPAAYFPVEAKQNGAKIIVINPTVNAFVRESDIYIPMKTGEALPAILNLIRN
ncbi:MAG: NAD-dependent deacylase [Proteobacteria bacterium]|nr:NAD-dependent deacylase [Pseudomonadota bacterium]